MRLFILIIAAGIFLKLSGDDQTDSIYFNYADYDAYKVISSNINFSNTDSLSMFNLSGLNSKTFYEKYSKNDFGVKGDFSVAADKFRYGLLLSTSHISNSSSSRPAFSDVLILPSMGFSGGEFNARAAAGYISKKNEIYQKTGQALDTYADYSYGNGGLKLKVRSNLKADNTDEEMNYNSDSAADLVKFFEGGFGNFNLNGSGNLSRYHFPDGTEKEFMIDRYEYNAGASFLYIVSETVNNTVRAGFYARNRDTYSDGKRSNYNSNTNISLSDEIAYSKNSLSALFRFDFDTGGDKFSLSYDMTDKSLSYYNISFGSSVFYRTNGFTTGLTGKVLKHEYKSLTDSNLEDRDIIKMNVTPEATYSKIGNLTITQSFPVEYYKMVNISSLRSVNNYIDRVVNSITDVRGDISDKIYVTGRLNFKSFFRSYDYDDNFSSSFVLKDHSVSDTLSYRPFKKVTVKLSARYGYEEYGNFNYNDFTENPQSFKNSYYSSLSVRFGDGTGFGIRPEYYFHEIDSYKFDQDDFSEYDLSRVYIAHGPKIGATYDTKTFHVFSGLEIDNFRENKTLVRFRIESFIRFD